MSTWKPIVKTPLWKRFLPVWLHGPAVLLVQISIAGLVIFLGVVFFYFLVASKFDLDEVGKLPRKNTFYDRNGEEIQGLGGSGGKMIGRSEIPDFLVEALAAREDARFFEHGGVDVRGLFRATLRNVKDRDFTQGASTLSMQLARNTYDMRAKSLHRKAVEIALTLRIEGRYSKDEILASYLNRIYFGSGAYGIEEAARTYFGKSTSQLHPGECAMLVGIIRGPHIFSPLRNYEAAKEQQSQTLARMVDAGFISVERAKAVGELEIRLAKEDASTGGNTSYAMRRVRQELDRIMDSLGIQRSGLKVTTTLDNGWQGRLEMELAQAVSRLENKDFWEYETMADFISGENAAYLQYAAVTTETRSGAIMALVGGRNYSHSRYDRTYSKRDLGSAFEPFVAAAAAERRKLVLPGKPVQTGRQIGPAEVQRLAKRCGISGPFLDTEDLFRGAVAATPMEMSVALATLGNEGKKPKAFFIRKIAGSEGELLYQAKSENRAALSPEAAKEAIGILKTKAGSRNFTGATGSERDAWVLRLGPTGSTAIWLGFDDPKKIASESQLDALLSECVNGLGG
ncbi:transglycosylase domain-containing protein [Luteolibacter sp. AS25]|uniref:transglycosylase domain-containing protein n=1 Tax=Luteolibacter sp. AS25 TaxID=3135776 RepID=UPI00398A9A18